MRLTLPGSSWQFDPQAHQTTTQTAFRFPGGLELWAARAAPLDLRVNISLLGKRRERLGRCPVVTLERNAALPLQKRSHHHLEARRAIDRLRLVKDIQVLRKAEDATVRTSPPHQAPSAAHAPCASPTANAALPWSACVPYWAVRAVSPPISGFRRGGPPYRADRLVQGPQSGPPPVDPK